MLVITGKCGYSKILLQSLATNEGKAASSIYGRELVEGIIAEMLAAESLQIISSSAILSAVRASLVEKNSLSKSAQASKVC